MPIDTVNQVKTLTIPLSVSSADTIVTVYDNSTLELGKELLPGYAIISINSFIKNLKVYANIKSIDEAPLPDFGLEDSETVRLTKTLDVEWKSARKQLNIHISSSEKNAPTEWFQVGSISLLNPSGYPFRVYNLMDLFTDNLAIELGTNSKIGVQIQNVGYGLLAENDTVTIHGSYVEEIFVKSQDITYVTSNSSSGGTSPAPSSSDSSLGNNSSLGN